MNFLLQEKKIEINNKGTEMDIKKELNTLIKERNKLLSKLGVGETKDKELSKKIDKIGNTIFGIIYKNKKTIDVGLCLESLSHLGHDPSIVYDDNGHWAVPKISTSNFCLDKDIYDMDITFFIEESEWRNNIRDAMIELLESIKNMDE
jgi:hypothetical protein